MAFRHLDFVAPALGLVLAMLCPPATAAPMHLQLASLTPGLSGFGVVFNDDGDGVLEFNEILAFSGVDIGPPAISGPLTHFDGIVFVPDFAGVTSSSASICPPSHVSCNPTNWIFSTAAGVTADVGASRLGTYTIVPIGNVPEPHSWALAATALAALVAARRRRR
jgi:MYXO-CTERM domain-containing protein